MYKAAGSAPGAGRSPARDRRQATARARSAGAKKDNVVDAEFVDVDDKKKKLKLA